MASALGIPGPTPLITTGGASPLPRAPDADVAAPARRARSRAALAARAFLLSFLRFLFLSLSLFRFLCYLSLGFSFSLLLFLSLTFFHRNFFSKKKSLFPRISAIFLSNSSSSTYGKVAPNPKIYGNSGINSPIGYATTKAGIIGFS